MTANLYTSDLDSLALSDVESFIGIQLPLAERPREGYRLDYKENVPKDIVKLVTAFANTFGGIVLVGVQEEQEGLPGRIVGVERQGKSDLKTRLDSMIRSSVQPVPRFSIGVVEMSPGRDLAVIRVEEGDWPPYMFVKGGENVVAVRSNDQTTPAAPRELESLFARRTNGEASVGGLLSAEQRSGLRVFTMFEGKEQPSGNFLRVFLEPRQTKRLRLDRGLEERVMKMLRKSFSDARGDWEVSDREHDYVELKARWLTEGDCRWRVYESGALASGSHVADDYAGPLQGVEGCKSRVYLWNAARDAWCTFYAARQLFAALEWSGSLRVTFVLRCSDSDISFGSRCRNYSLKSMRGHPREGCKAHSSNFERWIDSSELMQPADILSDLFMRALRQQRGFDIDYPALEQDFRDIEAEVLKSVSQ